MQWIKSNLEKDSDSRELLETAFRNILFTVGGLYMTWHFWQLSPPCWCTFFLEGTSWAA